MAGVKTCHQGIHPLLTGIAGLCLIALIGWTGEITPWLHGVTVAVGIAFAAQRGWVFQSLKPGSRERRRLLWQVLLAALVLGIAALSLASPVPALGGRAAGGYVVMLGAVLISGLASMVHHQTRFTARAFHPGWVLMTSFLVIIVGGTLLLKMPRATVPGVTCSWLDALFTSTSAVCVTGLAVQNTAAFFSLTGQSIILVLIQIGGLGIMTLTFFAAVVLFEGLSLHDRLLLGKMLSENRLARIGRTLAFIVGMTLLCEGVGAWVLYQGMDGVTDSGARWFHAVFHSVSAFCNAGFSTLPDGLASPVVAGNLTWQGCIGLLIIIGGLVSLVVEDLCLWVVALAKNRFRPEEAVPRLRVHTRLVLAFTAFLLLAGTLLILTTEYLLWDGPENGGRLSTALFHSVTARTAGFNTVPMGQIGPLTIQVLMVLMFIGGSPGGTAGGVRTTVFFVGLGYLWSQMRESRRGLVVFRRTIPSETGARALGLIVLAGLWLAANFIALQVLQAGSGIPETTLLFELVSAFATVGLSLDLTPALTDGAKLLLVLNMFAGRIGLLTVMATLVPPDRRPTSGKPAEDILLN